MDASEPRPGKGFVYSKYFTTEHDDRYLGSKVVKHPFLHQWMKLD